ncbi:NADH-quinone oxidoreductase subunit J family protein [Raineya orbicola]|jgi:NADH-quinone oxidoreductase subunit J|uniref:NADH-quinone oxidoreductase subunit J n=1 Tax=Raineya orbicola TaxID=2016530 RepID=A0A2N3IK64_9BACT|nr:NADH-quinone oxidoreductase subunit J [Raineya orbicola]PKQ70603.1 NADH:ubiquinone oxidoreductase subunit 6 (chain J) [Raineya orbicola]
MSLSENLFYFLSFLAIFSALMVVFAKNPIHSVLYLILVFFALTGHYILLNAQFLAIVNIIVYAGAIMVLFLFVIMFLNLKKEGDISAKSVFVKVAGVVSGGLLLLVMIASLKSLEPYQLKADIKTDIGLVENLGKVLYNDFLLPFELASILFLAAMVGAVMLGKRESGERNF